MGMLLLLAAGTARAQDAVAPAGQADERGDGRNVFFVPEKRQTLHATMFGAGWANTYDTYLSPLEYTGWNVSFMHETFRMTHWRHISTQGVWRVHASRTKNAPDNHQMWGGRVSYQHTWHYNWRLLPQDDPHIPHRLTLRAGIGIKGDIGGLYNVTSGNNPGQVYASASLMASVAADFHFRIAGHPFMVNAQLDAPFLGMMFSPDYWQPYYHIFVKGNYSRNIVCAWPGNCPTLHARLSLDIPVATHTLRIAYAADLLQSTPNNLRQHTYLHTFMLGWVKRFAILKRPKSSVK